MPKKPKSDSPVLSTKRKKILAVLVAMVVSIILITPPGYYGSLTVRVARVTFDETTFESQSGMSYSGLQAKVEGRNVYDYTYGIEAGGIIRTSDTLVSSSQGTVSMTMHVTVTAPSSSIFNSLGVTLDGGVGARSHTIYLGPAEGVRDPGLYAVTISVSVTITPTGGGTRTASVIIPQGAPLLFILPSS